MDLIVICIYGIGVKIIMKKGQRWQKLVNDKLNREKSWMCEVFLCVSGFMNTITSVPLYSVTVHLWYMTNSDDAAYSTATWTLSYCCFVPCLADADCDARQRCRPESVSADETASCTGAFRWAVTHQSSPAVIRHVVFRRRLTLRPSGWAPSCCLCT